MLAVSFISLVLHRSCSMPFAQVMPFPRSRPRTVHFLSSLPPLMDAASNTSIPVRLPFTPRPPAFHPQSAACTSFFHPKRMPFHTCTLLLCLCHSSAALLHAQVSMCACLSPCETKFSDLNGCRFRLAPPHFHL